MEGTERQGEEGLDRTRRKLLFLLLYAVALCRKQCRQDQFQVPRLVQPGRMLWCCRRLSGALLRCLVVLDKACEIAITITMIIIRSQFG